MTAPTHQMCGLSFGLATFLMWPKENLDWTELTIFFSLVLFGALLPDLDHPHSRLGRRIPILSYPLYWIFGHRTWTHSLFFVTIAGIVGWGIGAFWDWPIYLKIALAVGVLSHVIGDFFFDGGVPLFHPISKKKYRFIVTAKTKRHGSFSFSENLVLLFLILINVGMLSMYWKWWE